MALPQGSLVFYILILGNTSNVILSETTGSVKAKFHMELQLVGGNESLFAASGSHNQDGHHAHIW